MNVKFCQSVICLESWFPLRCSVWEDGGTVKRWNLAGGSGYWGLALKCYGLKLFPAFYICVMACIHPNSYARMSTHAQRHIHIIHYTQDLYVTKEDMLMIKGKEE